MKRPVAHFINIVKSSQVQFCYLNPILLLNIDLAYIKTVNIMTRQWNSAAGVIKIVTRQWNSAAGVITIVTHQWNSAAGVS